MIKLYLMQRDSPREGHRDLTVSLRLCTPYVRQPKFVAGLYCYEEACFGGAACDISALLDDATETAVGERAACSWKDDTTATITFGPGAPNRHES